jgi:hypothetical protein
MTNKDAFTGEVEINKTYLDTWGNSRQIMGYVVIRRGGFRGESDTYDKTKVWSLCGNHYSVKTGKSYNGQLVQLPPNKELVFWRERIKQIETVNCVDKLKLVSDKLERMRNRVKELEENI